MGAKGAWGCLTLACVVANKSQERLVWVRRSAQLLHLCALCCCPVDGCRRGGAAAPSAASDLISAAASRCMGLLMDPGTWKGGLAGG